MNCGLRSKGVMFVLRLLGGVVDVMLCAQTVGRCLFELMSCVIVVV